MKLNNLLLFGLLLSTGILNAQTDFRPGYIVNATGDTLYGQIDYRGDLLMGSTCRFKNADNSINDYSPNDIIAYRFIDSKYYESRVLKSKKVFLEYLIKGKVNIYYIRDDKGDHYYLDKEGVKLTEIPYEEDIRFVGDKRVLYESKKHIGILNYYMQDAPEFQSRIQSVKKPEHQTLIKLAEDYHNAVCEGGKCIIYEKKRPLIKVSITPFVGLTKYNGYDKFINELGGFLYFSAPRANEKIYFKTGLVYHELSENGETLHIYKIPIQFQYSYRVYSIQPNISGGFNFFKFGDDKGFEHTLSLNAGLDYNISNKISLITAFNSDFTPISNMIMNKDLEFDIISYSIIVGLRIDL